MKQIALLVNSLSAGGAERVVSNISLNLPDNISCSIVIFNNRIDYLYKGDLLVLKKPSTKIVFKRIRNFLGRYKQIKEIKNSKSNVPIISFLEQPNLLNILTKKQGKSIVSVRNYMSVKHKKGLKSLFWNITIKYGYKKANKIIAVSEGVKRDLIESYNLPENKIDVIWNSYSIEDIAEKAKEPIEEKYTKIFKKPVIITVGRLNKQKGQIHLIKAFKEIKKVIKELHLVILGEGELYDELFNLTKKLGVSESVHFLGFKSNPFKYIARSSVFTLTSYHEGFPNVLAESMACGIPVVSTDCPSGPREILAPHELTNNKFEYSSSPHLKRYGVLTPVFESETIPLNKNISNKEQVLIDSLIQLLKDKELWNYYSKQSLIRIKDFDTEKTIEKWLRYCE